jgi:hypothetical protein
LREIALLGHAARTVLSDFTRASLTLLGKLHPKSNELATALWIKYVIFSIHLKFFRKSMAKMATTLSNPGPLL